MADDEVEVPDEKPDGTPDVQTLYDDLSATYASAQAKIDELNSVIDSQVAEISRLKAANYDLLMQVKGAEGDANDASPSTDDDAPSGGIDSLFGKDDD